MPAVATGSRCGTSTSRHRGSPRSEAIPTGTTRSAAIVARVALRYDETKADLIHDDEYEAVLFPLAEQLDVTALVAVDYDDRDLQVDRPADVSYELPAAPVDTKAYWTAAERDIRDHLVRTLTLEIPANPALKLYGRPGETADTFVNRCREVAIEQGGREIADAARQVRGQAWPGRSISVQPADGRVDVLREQAEGKRNSEALSTAGSMLGGLLGGRKSAGGLLGGLLGDAGTAAGRRGTTSAADQRVRDGRGQGVAPRRARSPALEAELESEVAALTAKWSTKANTDHDDAGRPREDRRQGHPDLPRLDPGLT